LGDGGEPGSGDCARTTEVTAQKPRRNVMIVRTCQFIYPPSIWNMMSVYQRRISPDPRIGTLEKDAV
jgi:hypothetical protein